MLFIYLRHCLSVYLLICLVESALPSEVFRSRGLSDAAGPYLFPVVLAGIFGAGVLEMAYAEANESADEGRKETAKTKPSSSSALPSSHEDLEGIAKKLRSQIMLKLANRGISAASHPDFTVSVKGQKVSIKFQIPPACEVSHLLANLISQLGVKAEENGGGSDMLIRAWDRFSCSFPRMSAFMMHSEFSPSCKLVRRLGTF